MDAVDAAGRPIDVVVVDGMSNRPHHV